MPQRDAAASSASTSSARPVSSSKAICRAPFVTRARSPVSEVAAARPLDELRIEGSTGGAADVRRRSALLARRRGRSVPPGRCAARAGGGRRRRGARAPRERDPRSGRPGPASTGPPPAARAAAAGSRRRTSIGRHALRGLPGSPRARRRARRTHAPPPPATAARGRRSRPAPAAASRGPRRPGRARAASVCRLLAPPSSGARPRRARSRPRGAGGPIGWRMPWCRMDAASPAAASARSAAVAGAGWGGSTRREGGSARVGCLLPRAAPRGPARAPTLLRNARQAPSPPSSRPVRRPGAGRRRSQGARGSAPRQGAPSGARSS